MTPEQEENYKRYEHKGFSEDQLEEIRKGLEQGFDISVYARKNIPSEEMAYIRKYLFYKQGTKEPQKETAKEDEGDFEKVEADFESFRHAQEAAIFEKIITFAMTIAILGILSAMFEMLIMLSKYR